MAAVARNNAIVAHEPDNAAIMDIRTQSHPGLRKNGKPQSCEPCRYSKLACDHAVPCGRCARLQRSAQCMYDPSPTPPTKKRKVSASVAGCRNDSNSRQRQESSDLPSQIAQSTPHFLSASLRYRSERSRAGYQGKTAFSAILDEYQPSLGQEGSSEDVTDSADDTKIDPYCVRSGAEILSNIPTPDSSRRALKRFFTQTTSVSLHLPSLWHFHEAFMSENAACLGSKRTPETLNRISEHLCQYVLREPFPASFSSTQKYLDCLAHRWEMIGILFTCFAVVGHLTTEDDLVLAILPHGVKREDLSGCMLKCAEASLRLVDRLDSGLNVLMGFLSYRCSALSSIIGHGGETNYNYWRRHVQMCGDATALGLHRLCDPPINSAGSILFQEQQKRVFAVSFVQDKHIAVFLGRPPSLSKRYVTTPSILDADEDTLMVDDLGKIKANLNQYGYNKQGIIHRATFIRVVYAASLIYEDILELSLGAAPADHALITHVKAQIEEQHRQRPQRLHETVNRDLFTRYPLRQAFAAVEIQLIHLHQNFLLDRIEHGTENLHFGTAEEMLRIVLAFWNNREISPGHEDDQHWSICCFGIPAASAIAVGLWKATDTADLKPDSWRNSRSENIQKLSLFIAALDWVQPMDGNYELCQRTLGMLKNILDRILAPPTQNNPLPSPADEFAAWDLDTFSLAGMPNFGVNMDELFSNDWMNAPRPNFT